MAPIKTYSASLSNVGKKRQNNEDFVTYCEPEKPEDAVISGSLYIVADGVGGAAKGERASRYAAQTVLFEYYRIPDLPPAERLARLMRQAGNHIFQYAENETIGRMGTTMVAVVVREGKLQVAHVGDSRAYLIRNGVAKQLTRDHSLVGEMIRDGSLTEEASLHAKVKNRLTRSLGGEENVQVDVTPEIDLVPGDKILLCSDGLTRYALSTDLAEMMAARSPAQAAQTLVDFANQRGGADNVTVLVISIHAPDEVVNWALPAAHPRPTEVPIWEQETDESATTRYPRQQQAAFVKWIPAAALLGVAVIVLGVFALTPGPKKDEAATQQTLSTTVPVNTTIIDLPIAQNTPTLIQAVPTATLTPPPQPSNEAIGSCEYTVSKRDEDNTIAKIAKRLNTTYLNVTCRIDKPWCKDGSIQKPTNGTYLIYLIYPDQVLVFPLVNKSDCANGGGTFISVPSQP